MRTIVLAALLCLVGLGAQAQTYFGVLSVPANSGPGGSCCSTVANVTQSSAAVPSDGSCIGCTVITQAQYLAYQTGVAAVAPRGVQARLAAGLTVTFSVTTSANSTYAADPTSLASYQAQINNFVLAGTFIGASALITVADAAGTGHAMSATAFKALFAALQAYAAAVNTAQATAIANKVAPVWPSVASSITG
jgi:hypothetical protein